jgi:hypothetical protein
LEVTIVALMNLRVITTVVMLDAQEEMKFRITPGITRRAFNASGTASRA